MRLLKASSTGLVSAFAIAWVMPTAAQQQVTITPADRAAYQEFLKTCAQPVAAMKQEVASTGETATDAQIREMFISIPPLLRGQAKEDKLSFAAALRESRAAMKKEAEDPNSKDPSSKVLAPSMLCWLDLLIAMETGGPRPSTASSSPAASSPAPPASPARPIASPQGPSPSTADPVVISGGGIDIRQSEFEAAILTVGPSHQEHVRGAGKRQFAEDYLRMRLLADAGARAGLASDRDVVWQLEVMRQNLIATAQIKAIEKKIDDSLRQKYGAGGASDGKLYVKHILIGFHGSGVTKPGKPDLTVDEAKAKAEALHAQIAAGGSFEQIANRESYDGSGNDGGDLGVFVQGQNIPEFETAVLATPPGQLAPVTRTQFGFHIIRVERRGAAGAAQPTAAAMKSERDALVKAELDKLMAGANAMYSGAYFGVKKN